MALSEPIVVAGRARTPIGGLKESFLRGRQWSLAGPRSPRRLPKVRPLRANSLTSISKRALK
jgi:hypothetical protein